MRVPKQVKQFPISFVPWEAKGMVQGSSHLFGGKTIVVLQLY